MKPIPYLLPATLWLAALCRCTTLWLAALPAWGQWPTSPDSNLIVAYGGSPQMVSDGQGGAILLTWRSTDAHLHAQRIDKYGYLRWGDLEGILVGGSGWWQGNTGFSICEDGAGGCWVAFHELHGTSWPPDFSDAHVQRFDSLGNKLFGELGVIVCDLDSNLVGSSTLLAPDGWGGVFVIWSEDRQDPTSWKVYGQHLNGTGIESWIHNGISISGETNYDNTNPHIASGNPGFAFAFWHEAGGLLWGQRLDMEGNFHWGPEGILIPSIDIIRCCVGDDEFGCVLGGLNMQGPEFIEGQRLDSLGTPQWGDSGICLASGYGNNPSIRMIHSQSGSYYAWNDNHSGLGRAYVQRVDDAGNVRWQIQGLPIAPGDSVSSLPVICSADPQNIIVAYADFRSPFTVRCQKYDSSGVSQWDSDNVVLFYTAYPGNLNIVSDMAGGAIVSWQEQGAGICAQQISANGILGEVLAVFEDPAQSMPAEIALMANYPNPFNEGTVITLLLPYTKQLPGLRICDLTGRIVYEYPQRQFHPGTNRLYWDGKSRNGAEVSSGIYLLSTQESINAHPIKLIKLK
ncbi:MAG TPA: hypothetical protein VF398_04065 [bacterium]